MNAVVAPPKLTKKGIIFTVRVDFVDRKCLVTLEALEKLSALRSTESTPMATFLAYEATINGVARRLVTANVAGEPLLLGPHSFH